MHHRPLAGSQIHEPRHFAAALPSDIPCEAMKTYTGSRTADGCAVTVTDDAGCRELDPRRDVRNHSPDGFEWGYAGSGPAQLALALAADVLDDNEAALGVYQRLKSRVVVGLSREGWTLTGDELAETIRTLQAADGG